MRPRHTAGALLALMLAGAAAAQEANVVLKDAPGRDKTMQCVACHSVDYIQMNGRFLDKAGWTGEVNKMLKVYGAPIAKEDVEAIVAYLTQNYGKTASK